MAEARVAVLEREKGALHDRVEELHEYVAEVENLWRDVELMEARLRIAERDAESTIVEYAKAEVTFFGSQFGDKLKLGGSVATSAELQLAEVWFKRGNEINATARKATDLTPGERLPQARALPAASPPQPSPRLRSPPTTHVSGRPDEDQGGACNVSQGCRHDARRHQRPRAPSEDVQRMGSAGRRGGEGAAQAVVLGAALGGQHDAQARRLRRPRGVRRGALPRPARLDIASGLPLPAGRRLPDAACRRSCPLPGGC